MDISTYFKIVSIGINYQANRLAEVYHLYFGGSVYISKGSLIYSFLVLLLCAKILDYQKSYIDFHYFGDALRVCFFFD